MMPLNLDAIAQQQTNSALQAIADNSTSPLDAGSLPWVTPPPGYLPFTLSAAIQLPLPAAPEAIILSWQVPPGFDGVIKYHAHYLGGQGFQDGSGTLIWSMQIDGRALKGYDALLTQMGNSSAWVPSAGILVAANQMFTYVIRNVNLVGQVIWCPAVISGYLWPRHLSP